MLTRRQPGGDRRQGGRGRGGRDGRDRRRLHERQAAEQGAALLHLLPPEPVEHQQHDLISALDPLREPRRWAVRVLDEHVDDVRGARTVVGGQHRRRPRTVGVAGCTCAGVTSSVAPSSPTRRASWPCPLPTLPSSGPPPATPPHLPEGSRPADGTRHAYDGSVKVSTRGDYASRALLSLALHQGDGPTSVRDIAERTGLPQPYLEQILLALKGAGLVRSKRGVGGGYVLARDPGEITLAQIVSAVDGPIQAGDFGQPHTDGVVRPRGPVRAAGDLARRRRPDASAARGLHARRPGRDHRGQAALARGCRLNRDPSLS